MRQIFSIRFLAAVGAVVGLFFLLTTIFAAGEAIEGGESDDPGPPAAHRIDFVDQVFSSENADFRLDVDGRAANDTVLIIDESRSLRIVAGTPGEMHCPDLGAIGACAVVADLLGEAVVWFALVPMGANRTVDFPAIDTLEDGYAHLVNGWQLEYAPVLDRRCEDADGNEVEFVSYREFRDTLGDEFISVYSLDSRRLEIVECGARVAYAPQLAGDEADDVEDGDNVDSGDDGNGSVPSSPPPAG